MDEPYLPIFRPVKTGDSLIDSINDWGYLKYYSDHRELIKKYWDPNLSEASNRANILNIYAELHCKKPYYPMLPNGELDVEALKLKHEKEEKERHEAQLKYEAEMKEKEKEREAEERAYKNTIFGKLDRFLNDFPLLFWLPK